MDRDERAELTGSVISVVKKRQFRGLAVDTDQLADLQEALDLEYEEGHMELLDMVPRSIKRAHAEKGLKFSRDDFIRDILFRHPDGFNFQPRVFTKSTRNLPDDQKVPSASSKDHLPYFADDPFVAKLIDHLKLTKLRSTYVGMEEDPKLKGKPSGFWKYLDDYCEIHPSTHMGIGLTARCLTGDTEIWTDRGVMSMLEIGAYLDEGGRLGVLTHQGRWRRVVAFVPSGVKPVHRVRSNDDKEIVATLNHPFWTPSGWQTLEQLQRSSLVYTYPQPDRPEQVEEEWRLVDWIETSRPTEVSSLGRCRTQNKDGSYKYLKGALASHGYTQIQLRRASLKLLHQLICTAFHGPRPEGAEVRHQNGAKRDNRAANLSWGETAENAADRVQHRTSVSGLTKLSEYDARRVRLLWMRGWNQYEIATEFDVSQATINRVINDVTRYGERFDEAKVESITFVGEEETYDLSIEEDHSFVANGFTVHNSSHHELCTRCFEPDH